jgi:hypothetical protein
VEFFTLFFSAFTLDLIYVALMKQIKRSARSAGMAM